MLRRLCSVAGLVPLALAMLLSVACTTGEAGEQDGAKQPDDSPRSGKCRDLTEGLTTLRMISQGSHGAARHDLTVDFKASTLVGDSYDLVEDNPTPRPRSVDRALTDDERAALLETLGGICHPVETAEVDEYAAPGGSTIYEIRHEGDATPLKMVFGQGASSLATGDRFLDLSRDEFSTLAKRVPTR